MAEVSRRVLLGATAGAAAAAAASVAGAAQATAAEPRERVRLDKGWRFRLGHAQDPGRDFGFGVDLRTFAKAGVGVASAAAVGFDDSAWSTVDLPHDWAVELPFQAPQSLDPKVTDDPPAAQGYKPIGRNFPETSVGWYRKVFDLPASDASRRITVEFDGVFRDCVVMFNGYVVGRNLSGYSPFAFDLTDFAEFGGKNVLTVRADASLGEGWFYSGAGIYRHVWLVKTSAVHVPQWGTFVRSEPAGAGAKIAASIEVRNAGDQPVTCEAVSTVYAADGAKAGEMKSDPAPIPPGVTAVLEQSINIDHVKLWSVETPHLYRLVTEVRVGGAVVDRYETPFGVRTFRIDPEKGAFLNAQPIKLKGACNHMDHAGVGAALPDRLQVFRIERLKAMGSNAYRTAHNPHAPELMDACDRLGMLVVDETRIMSSSPEGLGELERLVRRDRNRPSVVLWSIGNEEPQQSTDRGARIARTMKALVNRLDPTRPVTEALDNGYGKGVSAVLDVMGFNYRQQNIDGFHQAFPQVPLIGTETGSTVATRGVYARDPVAGYVPAYDVEAPWWATTAESWWSFFDARPFAAGGFVWTGFDYRGEPTPFSRWPNVASQFGILDSCGFPKDNFHYYRAWWGSEPVLHLFPHWNWAGKEGQTVDVWVHANCERVELFLNGKSLGAQDVVRDRHLAWKVPYAPGRIEAQGFKGGRRVMTAVRETTGPAAEVALSGDRKEIEGDGRDLVVVTAEIRDARGRAHPTASDEVVFTVSGPGEIIGVGNGDPASHEPDKAERRRAFNGLCMALVQSRGSGPIVIEAHAAGLKSGRSVVLARP